MRPAQAFSQGMRRSLCIAAVVLMATMAGYGAFAREAGLSLFEALLVQAAIFAVPSQIVLVEQYASGGALITVAAAMALIGLRLLPMTVAMMPLLDHQKNPRSLSYVAAHFIAVTTWVEGMRTLPPVEPGARLWNHLGFAVALMLGSVVAVSAGHAGAAMMPATMAAALLFMTPVYFAASLIVSSVTKADRLAIVLGMLLGPVAYWSMPDFYLMTSGLAGGTLAWWIGSRNDKEPRE